MDLKNLTQEYLENSRVMQLATSVDNKPWVCNIHFLVDSDFNFYWISEEGTRHSNDISQNPNVAITIKIHEDIPTENYVIGVSIEGSAGLLAPNDVEKIGFEYVSRLGKSPALIENILSGKSLLRFYKLTPKKIVLFDTKNFPTAPRQEYTI